jgi:tetratricopeptide (TPR) repeat protein
VTGEFIGSPLYMSPEQIMSGQLKVDHRTDIYSLGATLYEWLTLNPPYPGETREIVISRIINSDPRAPRSYDSGIPVDLETICLKAMEKDPARRYQSAGQMRDDLNAYLQRRAIRARRAGLAVRAKKLLMRNRVAATAAFALVILASLSTLTFRQYRDSKVADAVHEAKVQEQSHQIAVAEQERSDLERETEQLAAQKEAILSLLAAGAADLSKLVLTSDDSDDEMIYQIAETFAASYLSDLRRRERERLEAMEARDKPSASEQYYLGAIASDDFAMAMAMVNQSLHEDRNNFAAQLLHAIFACSIRDFDTVLEDGQAMIAIRDDAHEGYLIRGAGHLFGGRPGDAMTDFARAVERTGDGGGSVWLHTLCGVGAFQQKYYASAVGYFSQALAFDPSHALALMGRARCFFKVRNYVKAIADVSRVIDTQPDSADAYVLRGECLDKLERYDESIADYLEAVTLTDGSLAILAKIQWAQANKQRKEQSARATTRTPPPDEDASPSADDAHREAIQRLLESLPGGGSVGDTS